MLRHLLPGAWRQRCDQPGRSAEFQNAKIVGRSAWIVVDASVRSAATRMVVSRVGGLATSLCRARRSVSRRQWDLSPHTSCQSPGIHSRYGPHSRRHLYVTYTEGFSHFVTSMTAPVASGWSDLAGWDFHPLESARLCTAHAKKRSFPYDTVNGSNRPSAEIELPLHGSRA